MVKVGFICEGKTERMILSSQAFSDYCLSIGLEITKVIDATGNGNLLPENIKPHTESLQRLGTQQVFVLTDMDTAACITETKKRVDPHSKYIVVIAVKQIESWFLAASQTLQAFLKINDFYFEYPENEIVPFETIRDIMINKTQSGRGISKGTGGKKNLAFLLLARGYTINESATHANCSSAVYFLKQLNRISN